MSEQLSLNYNDHFFAIDATTLLICNPGFWVDNEQDIMAWLKNNTDYDLLKVKGMILEFDNESELLMFILRWQ